MQWRIQEIEKGDAES